MNFKSLFVVIIFLFQFQVAPVQAYEPDDGLKTNILASGCVYRNSNSGGEGLGDWVVDNCDYEGAHYACFNGSQWQIAQAIGSATQSGEPQDGDESANRKAIDLWDPIKADGLCKNHFGPSYFFSVPVSEDEDIALGAAIANMTAAKKRTWIYYYSNNGIPIDKNYWLGNRSGYTNWLNNNPDNTSALGNADCVLLNRDTGYWQDENCSAQHPFACFSSGRWYLSKTAGQWRDGFATCQNDYSLTSIYAVPREKGENDEIAAVALPSGADAGIDFNQVWLNQTDLVYEEFFISNQTRQSWWADGQPSNRNNADCTLVNSTGNWISESCDMYQAYHACYTGDSSSVQWELTSELTEIDGKAISSYGFGYCKRLQDYAEYRAPNSAESNTALKNEIKNKLGDDAYVWINFSDQRSEGAWKAETAYQDFESSTPISDDDADCAYYSSLTNDEGNWVAERCYPTETDVVIAKGFACTNGYEWKVASSKLDGTPLESNLWKDGFDACSDAFGADYYFAGPSSADDNSRLGLALTVADKTSAWINVNDATNEGIWVANGPSVNLAPSLTLPTKLEFKEKVEISLTVGAIDPENEGIFSYKWTVIDKRIGVEDKDPSTVKPEIGELVLSGDETANLIISPIDLLNEIYFIDLQLEVIDGNPSLPKDPDAATATAFLTVKVLPPLKAAYDFNNYANPKLDWTGNGHQLILDTSSVRITDKNGGGSDYFAKMDASDSFSIDGSSVSGLQLDQAKDQYTLMYRFKIDSTASVRYVGMVQKGDAGSRQPAILYDQHENEKKIHFASSTSADYNEHRNSLETVRLGQWMTVAYVKNGTDSKLYIDKAVLNSAEPDPSPLNVIPDTKKPLSGPGVGYASGDWVFGNIPGASEGITGGLDDIRIYDRALTASELDTVFPEQPKGRFEFALNAAEKDEALIGDGFTTLTVDINRIEGDDGNVSVGYILKSGSADLNDDFKLPGVDANAIAGRGFLDWTVHDRDPKKITIQILEDTLREGTEDFTIELEAQLGQPSIGNKNTMTIDIVDKTLNVYGAVAFASAGGGINEPVKEDALTGSITVERFGDDTLGSVDVWFTVKEFSATSPEHFNIGSAHAFPLEAPSGNVVGRGIITFSANATGTPVTSQTRVIDFTPVNVAAYDPNKLFVVTLDDITDVGDTMLSDPENSAILGPDTTYPQFITDVSPGRISFAQVNYDPIYEDIDSTNRLREITLERRDGTNGAICVDFDFSGDGINSADFIFNSLAHTGSNDDVYWKDGDAADKTIQITAKNDQSYEVLENLIVTWQAKPNCDYDSNIAGNDPVVTPASTADGDHATATLAIIDQTNDIKLIFSDKKYITTEEGSPNLEVTVYATQEADFSVARTNNTAFSVYLDRGDPADTATEGDHYGNLDSQQIVSFIGGETSKTITIPIVDNCDAGDFLEFTMKLTNNDASLPSSNPPADIIKVESSSTKVEIENYSAKPTVVISNYYDGIAADVRADWRSDDGDSNLYVTGDISDGQRTPRVTRMGIKADITHNCFDKLQYTWVNHADISPARPVVSGLTAFSTMPVISTLNKNPEVGGGVLESNIFKLPFIIQNSALNIELEIKDTELDVTLGDPLSEKVIYTFDSANPKTKIAGLGHSINMRQYFRRIENNNDGGNNCITGAGDKAGSCTSGDGTLLAFNDATDRLVWKASGVKCLAAPVNGGGIYSTDCASGQDATQQWKFINDNDEEGVQMLNNTSYHLQEYLSGDKYRSGTAGGFGADDFSWYEMSD